MPRAEALAMFPCRVTRLVWRPGLLRFPGSDDNSKGSSFAAGTSAHIAHTHTPHIYTNHTHIPPHILHTHVTNHIYKPYIHMCAHRHTPTAHLSLTLPVGDPPYTACGQEEALHGSHTITHHLKETLCRSHGSHPRAGSDWPWRVHWLA